MGSSLFDLRIQLLILAGKRLPEGLRIEAPVANIDIAPTLLEWAGLEGSIETPDRSLLPLLRGEPSPGGERPLYAGVSASGRLWVEVPMYLRPRHVTASDSRFASRANGSHRPGIQP